MKKVLLILICCQMLLAGVVFAETNESVDIENTESDTLTISIPLQIQGEND